MSESVSNPVSRRFSGRQLTTIVACVCAAVVLAPTAVFAAATYSNSRIYDPATDRAAGVNASSQLQVGDAAGPLTVDGTVAARPVSATSRWAVTGTSGTLRSHGTTFTVTTLSLANTSSSSAVTTVTRHAQCGSFNFSSTLARFVVPARTTVVSPYPTGLPVLTGVGACTVNLNMSTDTGTTVTVSAAGYDG